VNVKYLSVLFVADDAFDTDQGYIGKGQFLFVMEGLSGDALNLYHGGAVGRLEPSAALCHDTGSCFETTCRALLVRHFAASCGRLASSAQAP